MTMAIQIKSLAAVLGLGLMMALMGCPSEQVHTGESHFFEPREMGAYEFDGEPALDAPQRILFGEVEPGDRVFRMATIQNTGRLPLQFNDWTITEPFELSFPDFVDEPPVKLSPGASLMAEISYVGQDAREATRGELVIGSNDPTHPEWTIHLLANVSVPCLEVRPIDLIDFGQVQRDEVARRSIEFSSCSPASVTTVQIDGIQGAQEFALRTSSAREFELGPGETRLVEVTFSPREPGVREASFDFSTNDEFDPERSIQLRGRGAPYGCPVAIIDASHPDRGQATANPEATLRAVPLDRIRLDSSSSHDPEGEGIERVEWTLVSRPDDTAVRLTHDADEPVNELYMELSGVYVVELHVWNRQGVRSCNPARMTLDSVSNKDIHIQLVWDTPADPNRHNNHGTDLDLHLLHPRGIWNHRPYDCFWQNMYPDWGVPGDPSDNPSLDIDKVDGWGPENINLDKPENGSTYKVGVHYFSHHGYGTSYATVRIFIGGELIMEQRRKRMEDQQFWHVANITWPSEQVTLEDRLYSTFPSN
ncbi:MAG: choice-of-anchor D domain-containing protein [Bradymonadaceae bacterium]